LKPLQKTLDCSPPEDQDLHTYFTEFTGYHPLLIQLAAFQYWNSKFTSSKFKKTVMKMDLRRYFKDWFYQQNQDSFLTWKFMMRSAAHIEIENIDSPISCNLLMRGLILENGKLFCPLFVQTIEDEYNEFIKKNNISFKDMVIKMEKDSTLEKQAYGFFKKNKEKK
jgi:hypothetical protein